MDSRYISATFLIALTQLYYISHQYIKNLKMTEDEKMSPQLMVFSLMWSAYHIVGVAIICVYCQNVKKGFIKTGVILHRLGNRTNNKVKELVS